MDARHLPFSVAFCLQRPARRRWGSRSEKLMLRRQLQINLLLPLVLVVVLAIPGAASPVPSRTDQTVDPRALFEQAQRALNAGDYAQAEQGFLAVLRIDPQSAGAYFNLGVVYLRTEKFDAAIASLEKARRLAPAIAGVELNLGLAHYRKQDFRNAIPHFASYLSRDPSTLQAQYLKGISHFMIHQYQQAVEALESIASRQQDDPNFLLILGICYYQKQDFDNAIPHFAHYL